MKATLSGAVWIRTGLVVVVHFCVAPKDRADWIPHRHNADAYFRPPRPVRRRKTLWVMLRRITAAAVRQHSSLEEAVVDEQDHHAPHEFGECPELP